MELHIPLEGPGDRTERVYRAIADAVADGRLRAGEALPPSRELAATLGVSRTTVTAAYDRLVAEGMVTGRRGAGTFVASVTPSAGPRRAPRRAAARPREVWGRLPRLPHQPAPIAYDFAIGLPDPDLFPAAAWRRATMRALDAGMPRGYGDAAGDAALRAAFARRLGLARAVHAGPDDVLVTAGAQQAFDLVIRVLVAPGDVVAIEEPGYPPVRALLEAQGARVVPVRVDGEGIVVDELPARARLVYTTPSHQFPTGVRMSLARRRALLAWAESAGAIVLEDDYDSEYRYGAGSVDPLQTLDRAGRVVYVGTVSKTLAPWIRIGCLIAPAELQPALRIAKALVDNHTAEPGQSALASFLDDGGFAAHVRRSGRVYAARRARMLGAIERELAPWARVTSSAAGLHVFAELHEGVDLDGAALGDAAAAAGVGIATADAVAAIPGSRRGLVLGFGAIQEEDVDAGIHRLATVLTRLVG